MVTTHRKALHYTGRSKVDHAYLRPQITDLSSSGSGGAVMAGNYAGGQPDYTPSSGAGAAVDTSNGRLWLYYSGAWN